MASRIEVLLHKRVIMPAPSSVYIDDSVDTNRIAQGVVLHPGCRIMGESTLIMDGAVLGQEAPVTLENCQVGPYVALKGGSFRHATFLAHASMGSGAHVREGTILEEYASGAHSVGLKQTILFPFVTLGSLINFCDCLMAGGTSRRNHSEVGSSYIHFNYTPNQDKATPSLLGDVPEGVMLRQNPIFLGGQGGLVGPCRLGFGTVVAAGCIVRKDELRKNRFLYDQPGATINRPFHPNLYASVSKIIRHNVTYIAHLFALRQWYLHVRSLFARSPLEDGLHRGLLEKVDMAIQERLNRFRQFSEKMPLSVSIHQKLHGGDGSSSLVRQGSELSERWTEVEGVFRSYLKEFHATQETAAFLEAAGKFVGEHGADYLKAIQALGSGAAETGTRWLAGIVSEIEHAIYAVIPSSSPTSRKT
ncbi:hypothetical protein ACFL0Q_03220 [Thermodesulfobacteriota bacterium]